MLEIVCVVRQRYGWKFELVLVLDSFVLSKMYGWMEG